MKSLTFAPSLIFFVWATFGFRGYWPESGPGVVQNVVLLCTFYFFHSALAGIDRYKYLAINAGMILLTMGLWHDQPALVWDLGWNYPIALMLVYWLAVVLFVQHIWVLLGIREPSRKLVTTGIYSCVRHPMHLFLLIFLAATPRMTEGRLMVLGITVAYLVVAIPIEERKLVKLFGLEYLRYRERVSALLPFKALAGFPKIFLLFLAWQSVSAQSPADCVAAAARDLQTIPEGQRGSIRYLANWNFPTQSKDDTSRAQARLVLSFHVNSLSREPEIVPLFEVPGCQGAVLRINLEDYGITTGVWEKLSSFDPYFHVTTTTTKTVRKKTSTGSAKSTRRIVKPAEEVTTTEQLVAPWAHDGTKASQDALGFLIEASGSKSPMLRGDWFFRATAIQDGGARPGYYDFLGLGKKTADFQELIGADVNLARTKFKDELAAAIRKSTVALNNRRLVRLGKIGGGYWLSLDAKDSTGKRNFLRQLDEPDFKPVFDATEQFGHLPNGLMAWWLADSKDNRQDNAPDFIASDGEATGTDRRVHANFSCVRCHLGGVKPLDDWARATLRAPFGIQSTDYAKIKRLRQLYLSDLTTKIRGDDALVDAAVFKATGMKREDFIRIYSDTWDRYAETDFDLDRIALEVGYPRQRVEAALRGYASVTKELDPVLAGLLQNPPVGIRAEHWEEVFPLVMNTVKGYVAP